MKIMSFCLVEYVLMLCFVVKACVVVLFCNVETVFMVNAVSVPCVRRDPPFLAHGCPMSSSDEVSWCQNTTFHTVPKE